ncbi:MAG: hypothetical protein AAFY82_08745 [Pseudomonadota bacterium]
MQRLFIAACLAGLMVPNAPMAWSETPPCVEDRAALLSLDFNDFDQDMNGGWRAIAQREGCELDAADLIAQYRAQVEDDPEFQGLSTLIWHEAQVRALADQIGPALALFKQANKPVASNGDRAWKHYVEATIAFLEHDRDALDAAHAALKALPEPDHWASLVARTEEKYGFTPVWPNNLHVVEALQACFEDSYAVAYSKCNRGLARSQ